MGYYTQASIYYDASYTTTTYNFPSYFDSHAVESYNFGNGYYYFSQSGTGLYSLRGGTDYHYVSTFNPDYGVSNRSYTETYGRFDQYTYNSLNFSTNKYYSYNSNYYGFYERYTSSYYADSFYGDNAYYEVNSLSTYYGNAAYGYYHSTSY